MQAEFEQFEASLSGKCSEYKENSYQLCCQIVYQNSSNIQIYAIRTSKTGKLMRTSDKQENLTRHLLFKINTQDPI